MKNKNEGKHTPGPWRVYANSLAKLEIRADEWAESWNKSIPASRDEIVVAVIPLPIGNNEKETTDARLIAAAPELLDIVKRMNWAFYVDGTPKALRAVMSESKALISKTEGRE